MAIRHGWVHAVIDQPDTTWATAGLFWEQALGWPLGEGWPNHPELRSFEPPAADSSVHLQHIDGPASVHLDVEVDDLASARSRWCDLGAVALPSPAEARWQVLRSPGGLPFCLVPARPHRAQQPLTWPSGHRTRLVQVCIDLPRDREDVELAFWRAGLGWRWAAVGGEFPGRLHGPPDAPLQLLFQRLDEPTGTVRAHLDLGSDDLTAEAARQQELGATELLVREGFVALRDPTGLPYCVTANAP